MAGIADNKDLDLLKPGSRCIIIIINTEGALCYNGEVDEVIDITKSASGYAGIRAKILWEFPNKPTELHDTVPQGNYLVLPETLSNLGLLAVILSVNNPSKLISIPLPK